MSPVLGSLHPYLLGDRSPVGPVRARSPHIYTMLSRHLELWALCPTGLDFPASPRVFGPFPLWMVEAGCEGARSQSALVRRRMFPYLHYFKAPLARGVLGWARQLSGHSCVILRITHSENPKLQFFK